MNTQPYQRPPSRFRKQTLRDRKAALQQHIAMLQGFVGRGLTQRQAELDEAIADLAAGRF